MRRLLKKSLALVLVLTMAVCVATLAVTMRQNALAAEETMLDWEIISAQYIAGVRDYPDFATVEGNTANDIFNYYIKDDVYSPSVEMLNSVRNDNGMKALMTTWQVYSLGGSPSSATKKIMQGEDYCETLLVSTLNMSLKDGIIATVLKSKVLGDTKDLRDMFYDFCDLGDDFDLSKNLGEVSDGLTKAVNKKYKETPDKAKSITGKIGDIIKYSKNITEVIQKVATYSSMLDLDDYSKTWLKQMKNANESSIQDPDMRIALNKLIEASESDSGFANVALLESGFTGVEWIVQKGISEGIKALCASSPIVSSIFAGLSVSNTICNLFFSTDDVCEQFFVMDKLEKLQELARSVAKDEQTSFVADQNNINAQRFTKSVELYFRSITEVDCDCMKKFVTNLYEGGYLSDTLALLMGASGNYEAHIDALESLRQARISNYNYMIQYCKCGFRLESESSFLYYFPPEDTEIPITGLSLEPLQSIDSYPEGIDLQVGDFITLFPIYTPSNTTQTGVAYSSSDKSIVDVGTSGILFGESVGTATITVTSIYDKNIKTSIDIRVGEKTESSGEPGGIVIPESDFKYTIIDGKVIITGLKNENIKTAKIPSRIEGYPVTSIGNSAFMGAKITSIEIPNSVTSIGSAAFAGAGLTKITIPDSVISIGSGAFALTPIYNKGFINSVLYIGNHLIEAKDTLSGEYSIWSGTKTIANCAFSSCDDLESVTIPDSVTSIGSSAFSHCTGLTNVTIGNGVTSIGDSAFKNCTGLTNITIPDSVTNIGDNAFQSCIGLTSVTISNGVTRIGNHAFGGCSNLSELTIGDRVTSVGESAFEGCAKLTNLVIPDNVTSIGYEAFRNCTGLTSVTIPNSVTSIGHYAFYNCTGLMSVTIGNSVTSIGEYAFGNCTNLTNIILNNKERIDFGLSPFGNCKKLTNLTLDRCVSDFYFEYTENLSNITVSSGNMYYSSKDGVLFDKNQTRLIKYPCKRSGESYVIPDTVTSVESDAFHSCVNLTSVIVSDNVTSMGDWAFFDCSNLTEASLPCGLQIESDSSYVSGFFTSCDNLTKLTITRGSDGVFTGLFGAYMDSVKEIEFANGVTEICSEAIFYLKSLESVIIPCSVTNIDTHAFYKCENLKNIVIPGDIENVGNSPFSGCYPENIVIAEGSAVINHHFLGCLMNTYDSVIRLSISDSVTDISEGCLNSFSNLEKIIVSSNNKYYSSDEYGVLFNKDKTQLIQYPIGNAKSEYSIPNSVTSIGQYAFLSCYKLTNIEIPNSVTSISDYAFAGCTGLTSETIPDSVTSIGSDAFGCCTNLINITIPASLKTIYDDAFQQCENLTNVYYTGELAEWCSIELYGKEASPMCYAKNLYIDGRKIEGDIIIPDGVAKIGWCSFRNCDNLKSVTIPNSVTEIYDWAFENCISLTDVYYEGTEEQWDKIHLYYWGNDYLIDATIHYNCTPCTHILTHINNNATCTKPGTEYDLCSKCGAKLNFKSIPATGHNWSAWTITTVPTVKADGIEKRICIACGEEEIRIITKLNGVYDDSTGIEVIFESESCNATELRVEKSQSDEVLALIKTVSKNLNAAVYDIATYDNGIKVQPVEKVTVRIPIPNGFNSDMIAVYYVDTESDSLTRIPNRVEYGYVVFETDHFSYYAVVDETVLNLSIKNPSTTTINYGDSIILHADIDGTLPTGARIEWTADNDNFSMSVSADGTTCKISPKSNGKTVFTATVYDKDGNVISSDTQEMTAKAGLWQKIVAFFKKIFGLTKTIPEAFKGIL